jgi:hypothetical protein
MAAISSLGLAKQISTKKKEKGRKTESKQSKSK